MPAIPPEVLEAILLELPPQDAETIPTLLACTSVSQLVHCVTVRLDRMWSAIARELWTFGRLPRYIRLSKKEDRRRMDRSALGKKSPTVYQRITARPVVKHIIDRHLEALLSKPSGKTPHVLAIVELGEDNTFPFLDRLAFMQDDSTHPEDWLSRHYWARQARGAISRRKAIAVWKRIGDGWDGPRRSAKAFLLYRPSTAVVAALPLLAHEVEKDLDAFKYLELARPDLKCGPSRAMAAFLFHSVVNDAFKIPHADPSRAPNLVEARSCFPNKVVADIASSDDLNCVGHDVILAALLIAAVNKAAEPSLSAHPLSFIDRTVVMISWSANSADLPPPNDRGYIMFNPPAQWYRGNISETFHEFVKDGSVKPETSLAQFTTPSSARHMLRQMVVNLGSTLSIEVQGLADLGSTEWVANADYAHSLLSLLVAPVPPSQSIFIADGPRALEPAEAEKTGTELDVRFVVAHVATTYPWDIGIIEDVLLRQFSPHLSPAVARECRETLDRGRKMDQETKQICLRTSLKMRSLCRVGDIVQIRSEASDDEWDVGVVFEWMARYRLDGDVPGGENNHLLFHIAQDRRSMTAPDVRPRDVEMPGVEERVPLCSIFGLTGEIYSTIPALPFLKPYSASPAEISIFTDNKAIGKYFKRVDWADPKNPRFVMADDLARIYPED